MTIRYALAAAVVLALGAQPADAQVRFGPQVSYADDFDLGVGARAEFGLGSLFGEDGALADLTGMLAFDYYFPDCGSGFGDFDCSYWEINANVHYPLDLGEGIAPYVGGGLNFARFSVDVDSGFGSFGASSSDIGLNALGGIKFMAGSLAAGAEAKIELGGGEQFVIQGYVLLGGGGN